MRLNNDVLQHNTVVLLYVEVPPVCSPIIMMLNKLPLLGSCLLYSFLFLTFGSQHSYSASHVRLPIFDSCPYSRESSQRVCSSCYFCHVFRGDILTLLPRRGEEFHGARIHLPHHQQRKLTPTHSRGTNTISPPLQSVLL